MVERVSMGEVAETLKVKPLAEAATFDGEREREEREIGIPSV